MVSSRHKKVITMILTTKRHKDKDKKTQKGDNNDLDDDYDDDNDDNDNNDDNDDHDGDEACGFHSVEAMVSSRHKKMIMTMMIMMRMRPVKAMVLWRHKKMTKLCNFHSDLKLGIFLY